MVGVANVTGTFALMMPSAWVTRLRRMSFWKLGGAGGVGGTGAIMSAAGAMGAAGAAGAEGAAAFDHSGVLGAAGVAGTKGALGAATAAGALAGFGLERIAFRPFRRFRDEASLKSKAIREATLLSSLAISIIVREITEKIFGSNMQSIPQEYLLLKPIQIGSLSFANGQFLIFGLSIVMLGGLQWLLKI